MAPRNPSEYFRLLEERTELINQISSSATKSAKEEWLKELRAIERQLGIDGIPYNDDAFGSR